MNSSLLKRWLVTHALVSLAVIACCSVGAWWYASTVVQRYFSARVDTVRQVLARPAFPLTTQVLATIATLTQTELILIDSRGGLIEATSQDAPRTGIPDRFLTAVEPVLFKATLDSTNGNLAAASQLLGIHRGTLRERLKKYAIDS